VLPVAPRQGATATRVLLSGIKGSRAPLRLLPPLALHLGKDKGYAPAAEAILRDGAGLGDVHPSWRPRSPV
jgi:tRNA1(Val) A37 N6-methylase TrmN6